MLFLYYSCNFFSKDLFNLSFQTGIFPDVWKVATVVPIFKLGDSKSVGHYRPISLLSLPGKLLEKIVHARMFHFFDTNKIVCDQQGGFRSGRSTATSVSNLVDEIFNSMDQGKVTVAVFVDL